MANWDRLTPEQIREIQEKYKEGATISALVQEYEVAQSTIRWHTRAIRQERLEEKARMEAGLPRISPSSEPGPKTLPTSAASTPAKFTGFPAVEYLRGFADGQAVLRSQIIESLLALNLPAASSCAPEEPLPFPRSIMPH